MDCKPYDSRPHKVEFTIKARDPKADYRFYAQEVIGLLVPAPGHGFATKPPPGTPSNAAAAAAKPPSSVGSPPRRGCDDERRDGKGEAAE